MPRGARLGTTAKPDEGGSRQPGGGDSFVRFTETVNGVWIVVSGAGIFACVGAGVAFALSVGHTVVLVAALVTGAMGVVVGAVVALRARSRGGTTEFIAGHMATPELDVLANQKALGSDDVAEVIAALRHLIELGPQGGDARPQVAAVSSHSDKDVRRLAELALRAMDDSSESRSKDHERSSK